MKYYTFQSRKIVEALLDDEQKNSLYLPDFNKSQEYNESFKSKETYKYILESSKRLNNVDVNGLIFSFIGINASNKMIMSVDDFIKSLNFEISKLTNHKRQKHLLNLFEKNYLIEIEIKSSFFNNIFTTFSDFEKLINIPTQYELWDFDYLKITNQIKHGKSINEILKETNGQNDDFLIQAHLPFIDKNSIINIYKPMYYNN